MPASSTTITTQRAVRARRFRLERGRRESKETRSSDDSETRSEASQVMAEVASNNRFAVLSPGEPASGIEKERETTSSSDSGFGLEAPVKLLLQTDILPANELSLNEKSKDIFVPAPSSAVPCSKRPSIPSLPSHTPVKSSRVETSWQFSTPTTASISPTKPHAQPPPLVLRTDTHSVQSSKSPSGSEHSSPAVDTAAPHISVFTREHPPGLPVAPIPPDPLSSPTLATLPIHPSLDFKSFTDPKSLGPRYRQFATPTVTSSDHFHSDDPMHDLVKRTSGRIFAIAAEIAAANMHSAIKPVGVVMLPASAKRFKRVKRRTRKKSKNRGAASVNPPEEMKDESEQQGDDWIGKEERFWKRSWEK